MTLKGNNILILSEVDPLKSFSEYKWIFDFAGCDRITLENLIFETTKPINSAEIVKLVNLTNDTIDITLYEDCKLDCSRTIFAMNSTDDERTPDYLLANNSIIPYK